MSKTRMSMLGLAFVLSALAPSSAEHLEQKNQGACIAYVNDRFLPDGQMLSGRDRADFNDGLNTRRASCKGAF